MGIFSTKLKEFGFPDEESDHSGIGKDPSGVLTPIDKNEKFYLVPKPPPKDNVLGHYFTSMNLFNVMVIGWDHPCILDPSFCLILDCRSREAYDKSHIVFSEHYSCLDRTLSDVMTPKKRCRYTHVILYGTKFNSPALEDLLSLMKNNDVTAYALHCGYDAFERKYPFLCTTRIPKTIEDRQSLIGAYPSAIIDGSLFLGNLKHSQRKIVIEHLKITHIVNISIDIKCKFKDRCTYLKIKRDDDSKENLLQSFNLAADFIADAIQNGKVVLVHCRAGVSRSASIVIAFLMKYYALSLQNAYHFVKKRREIVAPNRGFRDQLMQYEEMLFGRKVSDIMEIIYR